MSDRPRRLRGFSYKGQYRYFVTVCTHERVPVFEHSAHASWVMSQIQQLFGPKHFAVIAYCVMPDHVHLLLEGLNVNADLRATMHSWKQKTGFTWSRRSRSRLWQEGFYDYVLRDYDSVPGVVRYIVDNPVRRGVSSPESPYPFVGFSGYARAGLDKSSATWRPTRRLIDATK